MNKLMDTHLIISMREIHNISLYFVRNFELGDIHSF